MTNHNHNTLLVKILNWAVDNKREISAMGIRIKTSWNLNERRTCSKAMVTPLFL